MPIFAWNVPLVFLISPYYSLELCIQMLMPFLFSFAFCFSSIHSYCKASQTTIFPFCISFSWGWSWSLPPVQCYEPLSTVLQALCLSDLIPWIYLSLPLYDRKGFDIGHTWVASLVAQTVKHQSTTWETWVRSLGWEDPLDKEMAVYSSTTAWKIPWTEEPGRLQSMG